MQYLKCKRKLCIINGSYCFLKYLKGMEFSSRPVYGYFCLTQAWLSWQPTAASAVVFEMVQTEPRVICRNTENIIKLITGREVMSGKVNLSFDEIPWDKTNLSVTFQHWKLQDGCWEQPGRRGNLQVHFSELMQQTELCKLPSLSYLTCCLWWASAVVSFWWQDSSSETLPLLPQEWGQPAELCKQQESLTRVKLTYKGFAYTTALHCIQWELSFTYCHLLAVNNLF